MTDLPSFAEYLDRELRRSFVFDTAEVPCPLCGQALGGHDQAACDAKMAAWEPGGFLGEADLIKTVGYVEVPQYGRDGGRSGARRGDRTGYAQGAWALAPGDAAGRDRTLQRVVRRAPDALIALLPRAALQAVCGRHTGEPVTEFVGCRRRPVLCQLLVDGVHDLRLAQQCGHSRTRAEPAQG